MRTRVAAWISSHRELLLAAIVLTVSILIVYRNSLHGPFIFDDETSIVLNPAIRSLWPPWAPLLSPPDTSAAGRPIVSLSLAFDYALNGLNVWGYHASNIAFHALTAILLYLVVRSTFRTAPLQERYGRAADGLALGISAIWAVHPVLTECVDYVIERTEILMGLFLLATLLLTSLGSRSSRPGPWYAAACAGCALGMGSKEGMVVAPFLVLLYDVLFLAGSVHEAWSRRRSLYVALMGSWLVLLPALINRSHGSSAGFSFAELTPWLYARTQPGVILHYLELSIWPSPLVVDYFDWPIAGSAASVLPAASVILLLVAATVWGIRRRTPIGFLGAWFFLLLAPTSSFLPLRGELVAERRLYLPLISIVAIVVLAVDRCAAIARPKGMRLRTLALASVTVPCLLVLGSLTYLRNQDYRTQITVWEDAVAKRPANARAHNNLGIALSREGRYAEATGHFLEAVRLKTDYAEAYNSLGIVLERQDRLEPAIEQFQAGLTIKPDSSAIEYNLAEALSRSLRWSESADHYEKALRLRGEPFPEALRGFAMARAHQGRLDEAEEDLRRVLAMRPEWSQALLDLALVLTSRTPPSGERSREAASLGEKACTLGACRNAEALDILASAYAGMGRFDDAVRTDEEAKRLALEAGQSILATGIEERLALYRAGRPFVPLRTDEPRDATSRVDPANGTRSGTTLKKGPDASR